jgi:patatin-like phospholipase/acyl hydrolase
MKTPEDEAFEFVEHHATKFVDAAERAQRSVDVDPYKTMVRNTTIDEIADALARFQGAFGEDTIDSFAIYIRGLKR